MPNSDDIYSLIGFALAFIQGVEKQIAFCTTYVLQDDGELTLEKLLSKQKLERTKTLGYFLAKIRERVKLSVGFDDLLKEFLGNRNALVHNMDQIPGWDLKSVEGVEAAKRFVVTLLRQSYQVSKILVALTNEWQSQIGVQVAVPDEHKAFFDEVDNEYGPFVGSIFMVKE